ncbi:MAG: two-component sensor histidine kinase [Nocardioides sp.]|nr:two-component sensor histidine kinase [Nocardioides sp.]
MSDAVAPELDAPWRRWGWLLWAAWLVFLVFPVLESLDRPATAERVGGLVGTAVFGVGYVAAFTRPGVTSAAAGPTRGPAFLGALTVVTLLTAVPLGLGVLSFAPFLVALGVFVLPRPWCWGWPGLVLVAAVAVQVVVDPSTGWLFLDFTLVAVAIGTSAGRWLAEQSDAHARAQEDLRLGTERDRVARDVHDVLGHSLTVVAVKAELAERLVEADPERARAELADIQALARQSLAEVRATVGGLRSARLGDEVEAAARALAAAGIDARLPDDVDVLDPRRRTVAAWAGREAVTNVVRHAHAGRCEVVLESHAVVVVDDGVGPPEAAEEGTGLAGLRERVAASGGRLELAAEPGGGTRLEVRW